MTNGSATFGWCRPGARSTARGTEALEPLRQGVREHFGRFEVRAAEGLTIRHDHGPNYLSDDFMRELRFLGMISSPSFVREPEGDGCAELTCSPNAQGAAPVGAVVRHGGRAGRGIEGDQADLQRAVADRPSRPPDAESGATRPHQ